MVKKINTQGQTPAFDKQHNSVHSALPQSEQRDKPRKEQMTFSFSPDARQTIEQSLDSPDGFKKPTQIRQSSKRIGKGLPQIQPIECDDESQMSDENFGNALEAPTPSFFPKKGQCLPKQPRMSSDYEGSMRTNDRQLKAQAGQVKVSDAEIQKLKTYLRGTEAQQLKKVQEYIKDEIRDKRGIHRFIDDPEGYLTARKQRQNRDSAKKSRECKKGTLWELEREKQTYKKEIASLQSENRRLKQELVKYKRRVDSSSQVMQAEEHHQVATQTSSNLGVESKTKEQNKLVRTEHQNNCVSQMFPLVTSSHAEQDDVSAQSLSTPMHNENSNSLSCQEQIIAEYATANNMIPDQINLDINFGAKTSQTQQDPLTPQPVRTHTSPIQIPTLNEFDQMVPEAEITKLDNGHTNDDVEDMLVKPGRQVNDSFLAMGYPSLSQIQTRERLSSENKNLSQFRYDQLK